MLAEDLQCLKVIALMGGCRGSVWVSSQTLGARLSASAQTASRRLQSLERQVLVSRTIRADGQYVMVTAKGEDELRREFSEYCRLFADRGPQYILTGQLITGLGEGRYYMSLDPYREQFRECLGFVPYPGTLNVRLSQASIETRKKLDRLEWTKIHGFTADGRTFGEARCLACMIDAHPCGIVVPGRSHYPEDIVEVVSATGLREALDLNDGDVVTVEVRND